MRHQPRVKGGRLPVGSGVVKEVRLELERTARKFGVSKSFVVHVALADHFGIDVDSYVVPVRKTARIRKKR